MLKRVMCCAVMAVLCVLSLASQASARNQNVFMMHNDSDWVITSFRTQEGNESFSTNWIKGDRLEPGDSFEMQFNEDGPCEVRIKVTSKDGYVHDYDVDFCRAREIFIENNNISYR